jgi:hypothetical protein
VLLAHAAPEALTVEVYENGSRLVAFGHDLIRKGASTPITKLTMDDKRIAREDIWPSEDEWQWSVRFSSRV